MSVNLEERDVQLWDKGRAAAGNGLPMLTLQKFKEFLISKPETSAEHFPRRPSPCLKAYLSVPSVKRN